MELLNRNMKLDILPHFILSLVLHTIFSRHANAFELVCTS